MQQKSSHTAILFNKYIFLCFHRLSALILSLLLMAGSANSGEDDRVYVFAFSNDGPPANYMYVFLNFT